MATLIEAITAFRPRLALGRPISAESFMDEITARTTLSPGVVKNVQECELEALLKLLLRGNPVHTGNAIYTPVLTLRGELEIKVRVDARLVRKLNAAGAFHGTRLNTENIGKTSAELAALWDEAHPDDPVVK
jgi:hypothetical protein